MKLLAHGAMKIRGSNERGDYEFAVLNYKAPLQDRTSAKNTVSATGYEERTLPIALDAFPKFRELHFPPQGLYLELEITAVPSTRGNGFDNYIVGFKVAESQLKAAA